MNLRHPHVGCQELSMVQHWPPENFGNPTWLLGAALLWLPQTFYKPYDGCYELLGHSIVAAINFRWPP
jgi:hypothetical protein